jgi:hypothetical protein
MPRKPCTGDELIAQLLIHTWMLTTGKTLPYGILPGDLTEEDLIDFWADEQMQPAPPASSEQRPAPANPGIRPHSAAATPNRTPPANSDSNDL